MIFFNEENNLLKDVIERLKKSCVPKKGASDYRRHARFKSIRRTDDKVSDCARAPYWWQVAVALTELLRTFQPKRGLSPCNMVSLSRQVFSHSSSSSQTSEAIETVHANRPISDSLTVFVLLCVLESSTDLMRTFRTLTNF